MKTRNDDTVRPMCQDWLYWDPAALEDYPHAFDPVSESPEDDPGAWSGTRAFSAESDVQDGDGNRPTGDPPALGRQRASVRRHRSLPI